MTWKTVQKRSVNKCLCYITNIKMFTLDNNFSGEVISKIGDYSLKNGKMQINREEKKGHLHLHSNCWYEFTYNEEKIADEK